jgi:hypothetical protein
VADTWSVLEGKGDGCFEDISSITMFADYRLPQILVYLGALKYSDELLKKLLKGLQPHVPVCCRVLWVVWVDLQTALFCLESRAQAWGECVLGAVVASSFEETKQEGGEFESSLD